MSHLMEPKITFKSFDAMKVTTQFFYITSKDHVVY